MIDENLKREGVYKGEDQKIKGFED